MNGVDSIQVHRGGDDKKLGHGRGAGELDASACDEPLNKGTLCDEHNVQISEGVSSQVSSFKDNCNDSEECILSEAERMRRKRHADEIEGLTYFWQFKDRLKSRRCLDDVSDCFIDTRVH